MTFPESEPRQLRPPSERSDQPSLAIVVTSSCELNTLRSCLITLSACANEPAKLVVVHAGEPPDFPTLLGTDGMTLTVITAPDGTSDADLRRVGAVRSGRSTIAFVKDRARERIVWAQHLCRGWQSWCERGGRISLPSISNAAPLDLAWSRPYLSVVVPAHDAAATLGRTLETIAKSDLPRELWELVVVDDGSTDDTALIAAQYADKLVQLPAGPHGPGYVRNRGYEMTLGVCVAFVNADVLVRHDTLSRFYDVLKREPDVGAVFGSYDARSNSRSFVSQYHNLLQHYHHQRNAGEASTFWSACGAVRATAFEQAGCFNEWHFRRRQLEDLELGQRIRLLGHRVVLRPEIQVTHLKQWTLGGIISKEIFDHGIPWMRLVNRAVIPTQKSRRSLRSRKKINIALTWLAALLSALSFRPRGQPFAAGAVLCLAVVVINDWPQLSLFRRERGLAFAVRTVALDLLYYLVGGVAMLLGWIAQHAVGEPRPSPATEAFAELDVKTWPPVPSKRRPTPSAGNAVVENRSDIEFSRAKERASGATPQLTMQDVPPVIDLPPDAVLH